MRTWTLAPSGGQLCGRCGTLVTEGAPLLIVTGTSAWRFFRCASCARESLGEMAPETMPRAVEAEPAPVTVPNLGRAARVAPHRAPVPLSTIAKDLPFDGRMAAAGRDPGDDDEA